MIALSNVVSACPDLLSTEVDGELVMMDLDSGRYIYLDRTGSAVWRELDQPRKVADLCQSLSERYEAPPGEIERDVLELLRLMADKNLIRLHA